MLIVEEVPKFGVVKDFDGYMFVVSCDDIMSASYGHTSNGEHCVAKDMDHITFEGGMPVHVSRQGQIAQALELKAKGTIRKHMSNTSVFDGAISVSFVFMPIAIHSIQVMYEVVTMVTTADGRVTGGPDLVKYEHEMQADNTDYRIVLVDPDKLIGTGATTYKDCVKVMTIVISVDGSVMVMHVSKAGEKFSVSNCLGIDGVIAEGSVSMGANMLSSTSAAVASSVVGAVRSVVGSICSSCCGKCDDVLLDDVLLDGDVGEVGGQAVEQMTDEYL